MMTAMLVVSLIVVAFVLQSCSRTIAFKFSIVRGNSLGFVAGCGERICVMRDNPDCVFAESHRRMRLRHAFVPFESSTLVTIFRASPVVWNMRLA